jgi:predicted Zn-dependent protease
LIQDTLATILLRQGEAKRALALLERAVARLPKHPEVRLHYAMALEKNGDRNRARTELEQLLRAHESFAERDEAVAMLKAMGS